MKEKEDGVEQVWSFFSSALLLVANILILLTIVAVLLKSEFNRNLLTWPILDQGWSTLIGSMIGFGAIGWQIRASFAAQRKSQEQQAKLNRDEKQFEAQLIHHQKNIEREMETKALSSALRGELVAAHQFACNLKRGASSNKTIFGEMTKGIDRDFALIAFPPFEAVVYNSNISRLHFLNVSLIADLVQIHAIIKGLTFKYDAKVHASFLAASYQIQELAAESAIAEIYHVAMRLRAYEFGENDPGTLSELRLKKNTEKVIT